MIEGLKKKKSGMRPEDINGEEDSLFKVRIFLDIYYV